VRRQPGDRRVAAAVRSRGGHQRHRGDDPRHAAQAAPGGLRRRLHGDHRRARHQAAPAAPDRALPQHPPLRLRHPPAEPGIHPQGLLGAEGDAEVRDEPGGVARRAPAADDLLQDGEHRLADRRGGRGLADHRGRHAEGDAGAQPRVHLPPPARGGEDVREARRAAHGPRRLHQGGRRRGGHGGAPRPHPRDHGQQLFRVRRAVGGARRDAAHGAGEAAPGRPARHGQDHGHRRHRLDRLGQRAPPGHGLRGGGDRGARHEEARAPQGLDPQGHAGREGDLLDGLRRAARRHGHDRHLDLGRGQEDPRHHQGEAGLRDHRRGAAAGPAAGGGRQAARRAGDRVGRDRAADPGAGPEVHRPAAERDLRLPGRDHRAGAGRALRGVHHRPRHRVGEGEGDLQARPQARHEAGRDLRRARRVHRRGHRPGGGAGQGGAQDLEGRREEEGRPAKKAAPKKPAARRKPAARKTATK
jgi:hypothetical protein